MKPVFLFLLAITTILFSCTKNNNDTNPAPEVMYFPPVSGTSWETKSMTSLGWNTNAVQSLKDFLAAKHTKSFMILVNGRIVMEEYMNGHTAADHGNGTVLAKHWLLQRLALLSRKAFLLLIPKLRNTWVQAGQAKQLQKKT